MQIKIEIRSIYGEDKAYPACGSARVFADIAGTKTLTRQTLFRVLLLGYAIAVVDRFGNVSRTVDVRDRGLLPTLIA